MHREGLSRARVLAPLHRWAEPMILKRRLQLFCLHFVDALMRLEAQNLIHE